MVTRKDGTFRSTHESNVATVMGQIATGGGFSNLEQSLSIIGIPPLSKPVFIDIERCLGHLFDQYLTELMLETGREEKQIAINNKRYHQGIRTCYHSNRRCWLEQEITTAFLQCKFRCRCDFWGCYKQAPVHGSQKYINTVQFALLHIKTRLTHLNTCVLRTGQDHQLQWKLTSLLLDSEYQRKCMVSDTPK